jgi:hypothetical protein
VKVSLHRLACRFGEHAWYEQFRYAPQGFASTYKQVIDTCFICGKKRERRVPYSATPSQEPPSHRSEP